MTFSFERSGLALTILSVGCFIAVGLSFVFLRDNHVSPPLPTAEQLVQITEELKANESLDENAAPILYTLDNGMKVVLKQNRPDEEDILIQLLAKGGYTSLPKEDIPSARIASELLWEAGIGAFDNTALSAYLYRQASELSFDEQPFYRVVNAATDKEHLENVLSLIYDLFTAPRLDDDSLERAQNEVQRLQPPVTANPDKMFDNAVREFNTGYYYDFENAGPIPKEQLRLDVVKKFIRQIYSKPDEFVLVMVGDFSEENARKAIEKTVGRLKKEASTPRLPPPKFPQFPKGNPQKSQKSSVRSNCVTRATFPLQIAITENEIQKLEFLTLLLSHHFREFLLGVNMKTYGLTVGYEFPFFPFLHSTWITFQYQTETLQESELLFNKILQELKRLGKEGFNPNDLALAKMQAVRQEEYWMTENSYWLNRLTSIAIWNWPLTLLEAPPLEMTLEDANSTLRSFLNPNEFSRFSLGNK